MTIIHDCTLQTQRSVTTMLSTSQVAVFLGLTPKTVRKMCAQGRIPTVAIPGPTGRIRYRIPEDALRSWVRENSRSGRAS